MPPAGEFGGWLPFEVGVVLFQSGGFGWAAAPPERVRPGAGWVGERQPPCSVLLLPEEHKGGSLPGIPPVCAPREGVGVREKGWA